MSELRISGERIRQEVKQLRAQGGRHALEQFVVAGKLEVWKQLAGELDAADREKQAKSERRKKIVLGEALQFITEHNWPKVRTTDPPSSYISKMAGLERRPSRIAEFLIAFMRLGEATSDEVIRGCGYEIHQCSTEISDLKAWGFLEETGEMRETHLGGTAMVLRCLVDPAELVAATEPPPPKPGASACKGCGAEIRWVKTTNDKNMPVEPDPVGAFVIDQELGEGGAPLFRARYVGAGPDIRVAPELRYRSHHGTCPQADRFRK